MPGTALQGRAFTTATNDDTFRALSVEISLAASSEGRVGVCPVAKKTVTNAVIIALDYVCSGELTTVAALVIKMDPAEKTTNPHLLMNSIRRLLGGATGKVEKPGLVKFTKDSITSFLESLFRTIPSPTLRPVSSEMKALVSKIIPGPSPALATAMRVRSPVASTAVGAAASAAAPATSSRHDWQIGDLVWVEEGTEAGIRGHRCDRYKGTIEAIVPLGGGYLVKPVLGGKARHEFAAFLTKASMRQIQRPRPRPRPDRALDRAPCVWRGRAKPRFGTRFHPIPSMPLP